MGGYVRTRRSGGYSLTLDASGTYPFARGALYVLHTYSASPGVLRRSRPGGRVVATTYMSGAQGR